MTLNRIKKLDPEVSIKIAAGEVIHRPQSVLKELIENSLDAGANFIDILLKKSGIELIQVSDDGVGIIKDDLKLVTERHTTSKLTTIEDLEKIKTLGFRGEGIPSIFSVSALSITSNNFNNNRSQQAWKLMGAGGVIEQFLPAAHPLGTTITVRDLFFNVPARRRFLKSDATELRHQMRYIEQMALCYPKVHFKLTHNQQLVFDLPVTSAEQRMARLLGKNFKQAARYIDYYHENYHITGWLAEPEFSRRQTDFQYLYINSRPVKNQLITHIIKNLYNNRLETGRFPAFILSITVPPESVDVNVHPQKLEVRFREEKKVYNLLKQAIQPLFKNFSNININIDNKNNNLAILNILQEPQPNKNLFNNFNNTDNAEQNNLGKPLAQLHDTYILAQNQLGLIIIDLHAAHERILYAELKEQLVTQKQLAGQLLLTPIILTLPAHEIVLVETSYHIFKRLGIDFDLLDLLSKQTNKIRITQIPSLLISIHQNINIEQLFLDILAQLNTDFMSDNINFNIDQLDKILRHYACRYALKAGTKMSLEEMKLLLRKMEAIESGDRCCHGRPTYHLISNTDLDRYFHRGE